MTTEFAHWRVHPVTLRFARHRERGYRLNQVRQSLTQIRLAIIVGSAFFLSFAALDITLPLTNPELVLLLRFGVFMPLAAAVLGATYMPTLHRWLLPFAAFAITATAGLMVTMSAVTPWPVNVAYYVGVLFAMMFCFGVVNLPFLLATASGVMMAAGDIITTVAADTMPSAQAQASAFTTVAFVVAGAMICYRRDRAEHMSFASSHKLAIRNTQIEQERARLEVRVQERLAEREHLSHELHHRVYNNLQIVTSMLRLERSERSNQDIEESFRSLENRLQSMTIAQRKLYDGTELIALELSDLLREVIAHRSGPETSGAPVAIEESAGRARIAPENTVPAALALNELLSMAEAHANGQGYSVSIEALPTRNRARVTAAPRPSADGEIEGCADMLSEHILVALAEQLDGSVDCGEPDARAALRPHFSFELPAQCSDRE